MTGPDEKNSFKRSGGWPDKLEVECCDEMSESDTYVPWLAS